MRKVLSCLACGAQLTAPLAILSGKDPSVAAPEHRNREPLTERGFAFKSYDPIQRSHGPALAPLEFTPQYWLNPEDLTEAVHLTRNSRRLNGCCGLDGCDGPNQLCRCGAEIGTLQTDCWTSRVFIPVPETTSWLEVE